MSDDEDYMSDKFLQAEKTKSLIFNPAERRSMAILKRKAEADKQTREQNKSQRVLESEKREEGLSSALPTHNKGFEMMMKMGYKPGQGVGKNLAGTSEPIPMNVKINRLGLGGAEKKPAVKVNPTKKLESLNTGDFRERVAAKKLQQLMEVDLIKSQKVCQTLDTGSDLTEPVESWYWPQIEKPKNEDENEDEDEDDEEEDTEENEVVIPTAEKLEIITNYLRNKYKYCIWCGATFDDETDLNDNCPGNTRNDH